MLEDNPTLITAGLGLLLENASIMVMKKTRWSCKGFDTIKEMFTRVNISHIFSRDKLQVYIYTNKTKINHLQRQSKS